MDDVGAWHTVAGIIGAIGNKWGGASGVCWGVKILPLRIIQGAGHGTYGTYRIAITPWIYFMLNQTVAPGGRGPTIPGVVLATVC